MNGWVIQRKLVAAMPVIFVFNVNRREPSPKFQISIRMTSIGYETNCFQHVLFPVTCCTLVIWLRFPTGKKLTPHTFLENN